MESNLPLADTDDLSNNNTCDFLVMSGHELKTPLTIIKTNLQLLRQSVTIPENINFIERSLDQVDALSILVSDMAEVSKFHTGNMELNFAEFDINALLCEVVNRMQKKTVRHTISFNKPLKPLKSLIVNGDRKRIKEVVQNILGNAIKFSPCSENIIVETKIYANEIVVKITDEGIGISQDYLDKIFIRFFCVPGIAATFSGSRTGLYKSSEIIKRHTGRIWVESQVGKGSSFYFNMPIA